jgi:hypothetical protein
VKRSRPGFPALGIRRRSGDRPHILILERIPPAGVEMIYTMAYWWQQTSSCTVSVVNVWPMNNFGAIPDSIELQDFDVVVVFPRLGYDPVALQFLDRRLPTSFREYRGVKVLMRQDENLMTGFTEQFLLDNEFDILFSCVPPDQVPFAYPRLGSHGVAVHSVLTGYVSPDMRSFQRSSYFERVVDVSYRTQRGGLQNGQLVFEKYQIGVDALKHLAGSGLTLDISLDPADRLTGATWRGRLDQTRSVLGTESGSNLFDVDGAVYRWAEEFRYEHRDSSLSEAELYELARPRLSLVEGNVRYAQVSPRHFEAAAFGAMQILYPGQYSGIFLSSRHHLEIDRDFSNVDEIIEAIKDPETYRRITDCAFEEIVMDPAYSIEQAVARLEAIVLEAHETKSPPRGAEVDGVIHERAEYDVVRGSLVQLAAAAQTLRPVPYYFDDDLAAVGGAALRVVLTSDGSPSPRRGGRYPWVELSLRHWVAHANVLGPPPGIIAESIRRLTTAIVSTRDDIERDLGGYDDSHGSISQFQEDCELALRAVRASAAWIVGGFPAAASMASDPVSLPAAARLAIELDIDLYIDFEGFTRVLDSMHGWQARFWDDLTSDLTSGLARCIVVSTPGHATAAEGRFGIKPHVVGVGADRRPQLWRFAEGRPDPVQSVRSTDVSAAARVQFVEFLHPKMRHLAPTLDQLQQEVLPLVERTFGLASDRYRSVVVNAMNEFRARSDEDGAYGVLFHALGRWCAAEAEQPEASTFATVLRERRGSILNVLMAVQPEMPLAQARATFDRFTNDIPLTATNRMAAWRLLHRLLSLNDTMRWLTMFDVLTAPAPVRSAAELAADVYGLQGVLGYHWVSGDHEAALPAAEALAEIHRTSAGAEPDANTMARVNAVRDATARNAEVSDRADTAAAPGSPVRSPFRRRLANSLRKVPTNDEVPGP